MKYLLAILAVFSALLTLGIFILFISAFVAWLGGGFNVILPGLGLVISGGAVLIGILIIGLIMLSVTVLLARRIFRKLP